MEQAAHEKKDSLFDGTALKKDKFHLQENF